MSDMTPAERAERFLALLPDRLHDAPLPARLSVGDHVLNPDFTPVPGDAPLKEAAVLIGIDVTEERARVVLTQRNAGLSAHAGQVAFPGGRIDPGEDAGTAALREAEEEIGLRPQDAAVIGYLAPYASRTGYLVHGVVAHIRPRTAFRANPAEVDSIFFPGLDELIDPARMRMDTILFEGKMRHFYEIAYPGYRIWGVTAGIIRHWRETVFGPEEETLPGTS
ncbi:MAG: CoA pyrophosphatase [Hyphomicrobiaceae bacterium]|nr:CoA pyrophosphatase [Hyphomicrobiaceae bacterium]